MPDEVVDANLALLLTNELQERAVVKSLLLYGLLPLQEESEETVAQFIFNSLENFHFDNTELEKVYLLYKSWYDAGLEPTEKSFVYYASDTKKFEKMYREVVNRLSEMEQEYSGRKKEELELGNPAKAPK